MDLENKTIMLDIGRKRTRRKQMKKFDTIDSLIEDIENLQLQLEEAQAQFAYECECNKQLVEIQKENERLKEQLRYANAGNVNCMGCRLVEIQAVKEFAEKLKKKFGNSCSEYYPLLITLTSEDLDELLKEYEK